MTIKLLQLNIWKGRFLPEILEYVKQNDFDILHFQEVSGGDMTGAANNYRIVEHNEKDYTNKIAGQNCFEEIKKQLRYEGIQIKTVSYEDDPNSYQGDATFYKPEFKLISSQEVWLSNFKTVSRTFTDWETVGRAAIISEFDKNGTNFKTVNTHLAWGEHPRDEQYKIDEAKKLYDELAKIEIPFVLTGDFNVIPETKTASIFDMLATNLSKTHHISNTLNPNTHSVKKLFPKGLAVDYIFTSPEITVKDFQLVDSPDLSDHFGLKVEIEI